MKTLLALTASLVLACGSLVAQAPATITADEFGHGTLTFGTGPTFLLPSSFAADPGPGGLPSVLTYNLLGPPSLVAGDLLITESGLLLDVVRFNDTNGGTLVFYSDNIDGFDAPADTTGPPGAFYINRLIVPELNGIVTFTPTAGQPGFVAGFNVKYVLNSDAPVPEPASIALVMTSVIASYGMVRRKLMA